MIAAEIVADLRLLAEDARDRNALTLLIARDPGAAEAIAADDALRRLVIAAIEERADAALALAMLRDAVRQKAGRP